MSIRRLRELIMHHLIIGYGYCGFYLAKNLLTQQQTVTALSRTLKEEYILPNLNHISHDLQLPFQWSHADTTLYYLVPPNPDGREDKVLQQFLKNCTFTFKPHKVVYFGSSAVYGNHEGNWVNEGAACFLDNDRQYRRMDAEKQWQSFCERQAIELILMRIGGIYGANQLPLQPTREQQPIINANEAPYINHIYVKDLVNIAYLLAVKPNAQGIVNIADGNPTKMGGLQVLLSELLALPSPPKTSLSEVLKTASPMKKEFILNSKRLDITRLKNWLNSELTFFTPLKQGLIEALANVIN